MVTRVIAGIRARLGRGGCQLWRIALAVGAIAGAAGAVYAADLEAGTAEPPSAAGLAPDAIDFEFVTVPEASPEAIRYHREGRWLWVVGRIWGLAVPAFVLLAWGLSARLRDAASSFAARLVRGSARDDDTPVCPPRGRRAARWSLAVAAFGVLYLTLTAALSLPLVFYAGFVRPHAYGLSNQSIGRWFQVWATDLGVTLAVAIPVLWAVYALILASPRRWWLWTGLLGMPVGLGLAFLTPTVVDPLYNDFGPLRDRGLEARVLALAGRAGVDDARVFVVDKSRDTRAVNAYVTGLMGSKRIVLWDTLLDRLDDDQVLAVVAHELGHYVRGHVVRGVLVASALVMLGLYGVHHASARLIRRFGPRMRVERLSDVASLPLLILTARLLALVLVPVGYAYSRHIEREADLFGLELTRDNRAAATAFVSLQRENLGLPRPARFDVLLRSTHPSPGDRIDFCNTYRPWSEGLPLRFGHLFRDPPPPSPEPATGAAEGPSRP